MFRVDLWQKLYVLPNFVTIWVCWPPVNHMSKSAKRAHHIKMQFSNSHFGHGLFDQLIVTFQGFDRVCSLINVKSPSWSNKPLHFYLVGSSKWQHCTGLWHIVDIQPIGVSCLFMSSIDGLDEHLVNSWLFFILTWRPDISNQHTWQCLIFSVYRLCSVFNILRNWLYTVHLWALW